MVDQGASQVLIRKANGLYSHQNPLSGVPDGALRIARNAILDRDGILGCRRGFDRYGAAAYASSINAIGTQLALFKGKKLIHHINEIFVDVNGNGTTFTPWVNASAVQSVFAPPTGSPNRFLEANGNFYATTDAGIMKNDAIAGTVVRAGMPTPTQNFLIPAPNHSSGFGFLAGGERVAYRVTIGRVDANKNTLIGAPSFRLDYINPAPVTKSFTAVASAVTVTYTAHPFANNDWVTFTGGDVNARGTYQIGYINANSFSYLASGTPGATGSIDVSVNADMFLSVWFPSEVRAGDFIDIYRTTTYTNEAPPNRYFRSVRHIITSGEISAANSPIYDINDDLQIQQNAPLYTNDTEEGETQANDRPPLATQLARYEGHVFYGDIRREQAVLLRLLDTDGPQNGDSITLTVGVTAYQYIFDTTSFNASTKHFRLDKAAATAAERVRNTMLSLAYIISTSGVPLVAHYVSGLNDPPGMVLIQRTTQDPASISVTTNDATQVGAHMDPILTTSGTSVSSDNQEAHHGLAISKFQEPESVPALNTRVVGNSDKKIIGLAALKDATFIFKEDGLFVLQGKTDGRSGATFDISLLDPNVLLVAQRTVVVLDNAVFALTDQGVVRVTLAGAELVSRAIESELLALYANPNYTTIFRAAGYESDRKYILGSPSNSSDTTVTKEYVYNTLTNAWTTWDLKANDFLVDASNRLCWLHNVDKAILQERKAFDATDYQDEKLAGTVTATGTSTDVFGTQVRTLTITVTETAYPLAVGYYVNQSGATGRVISVVDNGAGSYTATLDGQAGFATSAIELYKPIVMEVEWYGLDGGNAATMKQFTVAQVYFEDDQAVIHNLGFQADTQASRVYLQQSQLNRPTDAQSTPLRLIIPRDHQRCRVLHVSYLHQMAREPVNILQLAVDARQISTRTMRRIA